VPFAFTPGAVSASQPPAFRIVSVLVAIAAQPFEVDRFVAARSLVVLGHAEIFGVAEVRCGAAAGHIIDPFLSWVV